MLDYFHFNLILGDVAMRETSDRMIESRALDVTYSDGYVATLMRRDREVIDFTRSHVKNNTEFTNLMIS